MSPALPTPPAGPVPRFRIDRELGSGTTGRVFHGVLTEAFPPFQAGFEIAVKILRPELASDPRALATFEAEARAGRLVLHPNLVHVIASGADERGRFLVMPFVPGRSLREILHESGPFPEPLVRSVARQVAGGLAALHAGGLVHGDLKLENIRLDAEGNAVLLDLGFARRSAASRTIEPRAGSLPYIAPEQARGEAGSEASDVFSLGVVVYEIATGVHPFALAAARGALAAAKRSLRDGGRGRSRSHHEGAGSSGIVALSALEKPDADRLIAAIADARFAPPSRFVPQLSPFLDRLLEEALRRDPHARPSATELHRRLSEQESGSWWRAEIEFGAGARRGGTGEHDARHLTPLVGREAEMRALLQAYDETVGGAQGAPPGGSVWIRGGEGSGKSRLVNEFAARARARSDPPLYLYGRCREMEEQRPAQPILRLLERYLRLPSGVAPTRREVELLEKLVPPRAAETLARALDPQSEGAPPVAVPVALALWLAALGRILPVIVFLDDVSWAGDDTLDALALLAERLTGARILLVLGEREGATARRPERVAELQRRLEAAAPMRRIDLAPLDEPAIERLVEELFHHSTPRLHLSRVLWQRSRGNPGLVVEILRRLVARGEATPHADGGGLVLAISPDDLPLPGSLRKAIAESYRQLPIGDRAWLRRLSVAGGRIETDFLLAAFPGEKRSDVDAMLARLSRSGWLASVGPRYRFTRPALREAVYRSLSRADRLRFHAAAAAALRPGSGSRLALDDAFQLAFHLRAAEDHAGLLGVLRPLLGRLLAAGQAQRVHSLSQWGLAAIEALPRAAELERMRIDLLGAAVDAADRLGYRQDQRELLDRLADLELDPESDPETAGRAYLLHGRYAVSTGQYGLARGWLKNAVGLFERAGQEFEHSEALRRLSLVQSHVGELDEARKLARSALATSQDDVQRALAHLAQGVIDVLQDRIEPAMEHADRALHILRGDRNARDEASNRPGVLAAAHMLRARIYRLSGSPVRAHASASRAVRLARVAGERRLEAEATARLGGILLDLDRASEAEATLRESLRLAVEIEDRRGEALARLFLGILLWENADPEAAPMLARACELALSMGLNRVEAVTHALQARIAREAQDLARASSESARAMELLEQFGAELGDRIVIAGTHALVLATKKKTKPAREIEKKLRERVRSQSERIRSPLLRLRHKRAGERLLEAVLSPEGPVFPRVRIPADEAESR